MDKNVYIKLYINNYIMYEKKVYNLKILFIEEWRKNYFVIL